MTADSPDTRDELDDECPNCGYCRLKRPAPPQTSGLPEIPDDDADFTPDLARKIIAKYQEMLSWQADKIAELDDLRHAQSPACARRLKKSLRSISPPRADDLGQTRKSDWLAPSPPNLPSCRHQGNWYALLRSRSANPGLARDRRVANGRPTEVAPTAMPSRAHTMMLLAKPLPPSSAPASRGGRIRLALTGRGP